jgi:hypothetical protein
MQLWFAVFAAAVNELLGGVPNARLSFWEQQKASRSRLSEAYYLFHNFKSGTQRRSRLAEPLPMSCLTLLFDTAPRTPAARAIFAKLESKNIEHSRTPVEGDAFAILRAASTPFMPGIEKSSTTTSGDICSVLRTASHPPVASPQTSQPACLLRSLRKPSRTGRLSSAMRMRVSKSPSLPKAIRGPIRVISLLDHLTGEMGLLRRKAIQKGL